MAADVRTMAKYPDQLAEQLRDLVRQMKAQRRKSRQTFLDQGRIGKEAQELLKAHGCEGMFSRWCKEAGVYRVGTYRAIAAFEYFGNSKNATKQPTAALIELARHSAAAAEGRELMDAGHVLTIKAAKAIAAKYIPAAVKVPKTTGLPKGVTIDTPRGSITVHVDGVADRELGQILAHALRDVQDRINSTASDDTQKRSWFKPAA